MLGGAESPGGVELLTVTVARDEHGYGMKVSGDNPVYVQSVKEHGAAWRAGLRAGDRILRVDNQVVSHHSHQQVVQMIRANPTTVLTVHQHASRLKTPITAPVPANLEKQRQFEASKVKTMRLMLEKEQKYIRDLRNELLKVPDVRKSAELESAEQRCSTLQREIDVMMGTGQLVCQPTTPRNARTKTDKPTNNPPTPNTGFLSGLPRSLSNLTGQSLRNLRQARQKNQQENQPPLVRQNSDESNNKRRHIHNNTVPMVPTTCLDNSPPPLPPRSIERPKRNPLSPPISPLANPVSKKYYKPLPDTPRMAQSMPGYEYRRSSHSLDGELDGPQPNSIALQMSYPLVNVPPPPLQMDNRNSVPVLHMRSRSSPEQLDHDLSKSLIGMSSPLPCHSVSAAPLRAPPPGTPPPPYHTNTNTQPCADPQRAIISMEEDDSPASDNSTYSGLFSNLRSVRESKARTAVLLNWLLGERRCACACLLLVLTDSYRSGAVPIATLRRWAYEIHSAFLMPHAVLQLTGVDENMANEIEHILVNEFEKEELLRNVFRKARQKAKDELAAQLSEFQVKRQVGLASLYGPDDSIIDKCDVDKIQEQAVVERLMCARLRHLAGGPPPPAAGGEGAERHNALMAAVAAAALCLQCRPAAVASAVGTQRASFLQRDKLYKQRVKQITKQHQQPYVVRGHHLQLQALTSVAHCHHCDNVLWGLAPQAYFCTDCKLRVHRACTKHVEEPCCIDGDHHNNRISRFMERIHHNNQINSQDSADKKSKKGSGTANFLNMERSFRKAEDEQPWDQNQITATIGETRREGSNEEPTAPDADVDTSDAATKDSDKDNTWRAPPPTGRGVNRAESCRERDAPRRGKHRNASDPNRLTAHNNNDLEPGSATAPSGSSSSSSLSSRSNESNTVAAEQQASQSDLSDEDEALAAQWADSISPHILSSISLSSRLRKRQEVIHELIVSEGSHVRWLKVLGRVFLRPLESQPSLLSPDDLRALFPNLPSVRERHVRLYSELRALRNDVDAPLVDVRAVADAMLNTLGDSGYASTLSRFCRGQRMALEALRERRRKNKELHQFLAAREQLPLCGRLQLRDLLACVWQRLTKYQLLLESVLKTVESEDNTDVERVQKALGVAKEVLHGVDTAIRTSENEHRLRSIQSKLEIRAPGPEFEELRRLDLTTHALTMEGELAIRNDSNKKIQVLALMLEDSLVLIQREGDKFLLKPIAQPSQPQNLSPLIKWDKVLFRPNAAVRNTFFLMNINGVQMHELSTNSASEYATWVKHIQEAPLAKLTELKLNITPSHQASRSTDDSGINVSRNPSDASEKSNSTAEDECEKEALLSAERAESERDRISAERAESEKDRASAERDRASAERAESGESGKESEREERVEKEDIEREENHTIRRPTVGRISTHDVEPPPALEPKAAITVIEPAAHTAHTAFSNQERLRRLDAGISRCLRAKALVVGEMLGVPQQHYNQVADMAVAEALGQVDVSLDPAGEETVPDMQQLLLAACTQANQLTLLIRGALSVNETSAVAARARIGRCDSCRRTREPPAHVPVQPSAPPEETDIDCDVKPAELRSTSLDEEYDTLSELEASRDDDDDALENSPGAAMLATRLVEASCGLQSTLARLLPLAAASGTSQRAERVALQEANDALRAKLRTKEHQNTEEISFPKADPTIQDQPSNGG